MKLNWIPLQDEAQLDDIKELSVNRLQVIFKHSTRCSISAVAKNRLENASAPRDADFYYLDLLKYRGISGKVESLFDIQHESPQVILIKDKKAVYNESHLGISMADISTFALQ